MTAIRSIYTENKNKNGYIFLEIRFNLTVLEKTTEIRTLYCAEYEICTENRYG